MTPVQPHEVLIGKALPGMIVGMIDASLVIAAALLWFRVPFLGNFDLLAALPMLYTLTAVGIGLVISSVTRTQRQAMLGVFVLASPMVVLSGFAAPLGNMPPLAELLGRADPIRWMLLIVRGLFLQNMPLGWCCRTPGRWR